MGIGTRWFEFQPVVLEYGRYQAGENREVHQRAIRFYEGRANEDQKSWQSLADVQEYLEIAQHYVALGELEQAFNKVRECDDFLILQGYYNTIIEVYSQIIKAYEQQGNPQEHWEYGASLTDVGNAYYSLGQYEKAIQFHQQSLEIKTEIGDRRGEGNSLNNLGSAHNRLGEYQRAIIFHKQSLDIAREIGDRRQEAASLGNLGNAYRSLGGY